MPLRDAGSEASVVALARTAMTQGQLALTANDTDGAVRWFDRAHRLLPTDPNAVLALAGACLAGDPSRAATLFAEIAGTYQVRHAWLGLAAARFRLAGPLAAAEALGTALSRFSFVADAAALADQIWRGGGSDGWCGLRSDGTLQVRGKPGARIEATLDGRVLRGVALPDDWAQAVRIDVRADGKDLLGSPIRIDAIRRVSGCVEIYDGGLRGWAWHPGDPERPAELTLTFRPGRLVQSITADDETTLIPDTGPLARARGFHIARGDLPDAPGPVHVRGLNGRDLLGSPLDPFADQALHLEAALRLGRTYPAGPRGRSAAAAAEPAHALPDPGIALPAGSAARGEPVGADAVRRGVTVVIPVHNGGQVVVDCLNSVLASVPDGARVLVVDDGSTDPELIAVLNGFAKARSIRLLRHPVAQGFPASANAGIRAAHGRDAVLLNSDTLVPPGWLERLAAAAYSARDIGTVTPLSNDATILSYPGDAAANPVPDQAATNRLDRIAARANGDAVADIPVGIGFCLFLRRDCLNAVGSFRTDLFAQGYGEENDLCLRARLLGWRNVALTGLFVGHLGGTSFGGDAAHLQARNGKILEQLHPGYNALIQAFIKQDPLAGYRRRMDLLRWREAGRQWRQSVIMVTHDHGGGVEERLAAAVRTHRDAGRRPIVLRPAETARGESAIAMRDGVGDDFSNLVFVMPGELPDLLRLLRSASPQSIEVHHFLDHPPAIYDLIRRLAVAYDVHVHDYAWFCPRISLVGAYDRYCGEPDLHDCESCVADNGRFLKEDIGVAALRDRSAAFLSAAARVIVPSADTGARMQRHFPRIVPVVIPHEDDSAIFPLPVPSRRMKGRPLVCVAGGIGVHKGFDVLLACARDAARRNLDLEFVVVGHTIDDARLMATGRVFVTGRFEPGEAVDLIAAQQALIGFVPSIWPETWCLSLGEIWRAGLPAVAFDIGAPSERIKRSGYGILLPLGLSPGAINNALVTAIGAAGYEKTALEANA